MYPLYVTWSMFIMLVILVDDDRSTNMTKSRYVHRQSYNEGKWGAGLVPPHRKVLDFFCWNLLKFVNTTFQPHISPAIFHLSTCSLHRRKPQSFVSHNTQKILPTEGPTSSYYPFSSATRPLTCHFHSTLRLTSGENKSRHLIGGLK